MAILLIEENVDQRRDIQSTLEQMSISVRAIHPSEIHRYQAGDVYLALLGIREQNHDPSYTQHVQRHLGVPVVGLTICNNGQIDSSLAAKVPKSMMLYHGDLKAVQAYLNKRFNQAIMDYNSSKPQ